MTNHTASYIGDVEFVPLSAQEMVKISVKRIHRLPTFDEYQQPVPEGLHDVALGAVLDKNCLFCHRLRVTRKVLNLFVCKLKLLQYGIVDKLLELETIGCKSKKLANGLTNGADEDEDALGKTGPEDVEASEDEDDEEVFRRREKIVRTCIRKAQKAASPNFLRQNSVALTERKALIKLLLSDKVIRKTCPFCRGVSPTFKKDSAKIIYRNPLNEKQANTNRQRGLRMKNPLVYKRKLEENRTRSEKPTTAEIPEKALTNGFHDSDTEMEDANSDDDGSHGAEEEMASIAAADEEEYDAGCTTLHRLTAVEVRAALDLLFNKEQEVLSLIYHISPERQDDISADMFFLTHILVPPNKYRAPIVQGETLTQAAQNTALANILQASDRIREIERENRNLSRDIHRQPRKDELFMAALALQKAVTSVFDFSSGPNSSEQQVGIKQRLERKEGLFRMNMMGKRVNFAARSVISPDPNIETNEIGVPLVFARKLTYPEPVTPHNFFEMKAAVINGPAKYPGAAAVENEDGQVLNLKFKSLEARIAIANQLLTASNPGMTSQGNKKVYRHLQSGDVVIMNRQPTLHKPSMMGHRARVLTNEKTIRMHYTNCNTYNADFDGDEMNMHFAQDEVARTEALQIADTDHQYLSSTAGKPLRGLIQDHISMGVHFTSRDTFFDVEEYQQLLYSCLRPENYHTVSDSIQTLPPAILKPKALWTGKQVISTVIKNITPQNRNGVNLNSRSSTAGDRWGEKCEEGEVIFRDGELLCGILDKAQIGPSADGLIHSVHELYGHISAGKLLSVIGRLLTRFLNMRAWSCGMEDLYLTKEGDQDRRNTLSKTAQVGRQTASTFVTLEEDSPNSDLVARLEDVLRDSEKHVNLDRLYNARTADLSSEVTKACLPRGLWKAFPANQMQTMTTSGAKGSVVNANLISCNLGQQVLEGRRVPVMVSGKTLPSFKAFETDPTAGGYVQGRFLTGIKPQEYFFHAMAGREGLIDTAVKTATSGYLQRCIVKGLEGMRTEYDYSVRDTSNGAMIQFLYGEDGLDVAKQKHLTQFGFLARNQLSVKASTNIVDHMGKFQTSSDFEAAQQYRKDSMKKVRKTGRVDAMDPVMAVYNPGSNLGSTSEAFQESLTEYIELNPDRAIKNVKMGIIGDVITKKTFQRIMELKYMKSLVDPGEAVGVVAAQSVGEPSTQMTLNTFHLAGHSAKNVTLGIPRLREIVMTGSKNIKTPTMTLQVVDELSKEEGVSFAKGISRLSLAALVDQVSVKERSGSAGGHKRARLYDVGITLFPAADYLEEYGVSVDDVAECLKGRFLKTLIRLIKREFLKKAKERLKTEVTSAVPEVGKTVGTVAMARAEAANNADDVDSDFDADDARQARGQNEEYDDPESGDEVESSDSSSDDEEQPAHSNRVPEDERSANESEKAGDGSDEDDNEDDQDVIDTHQQVTHFTFSSKGNKCSLTLAYDVSTAKILLLPIIEKALGLAVIQHIPGIGSCVFTEDKKKNVDTGKDEIESAVMTDGVNLAAMGEYQDIIYPHSLYTNSVFHMLEFYGVEAARNTIIREVDSVFKGHTILVDNRHLNLIADAMTHDGGYRAFSRHGMIQGQGSILAKMSFETVFGFMKEAVLGGEADSLAGPSAKLVIGSRGTVGTGSFDVIVPVSGTLLGNETSSAV